MCNKSKKAKKKTKTNYAFKSSRLLSWKWAENYLQQGIQSSQCTNVYSNDAPVATHHL